MVFILFGLRVCSTLLVASPVVLSALPTCFCWFVMSTFLWLSRSTLTYRGVHASRELGVQMSCSPPCLFCGVSPQEPAVPAVPQPSRTHCCSVVHVWAPAMPRLCAWSCHGPRNGAREQWQNVKRPGLECVNTKVCEGTQSRRKKRVCNHAMWSGALPAIQVPSNVTWIYIPSWYCVSNCGIPLCWARGRWTVLGQVGFLSLSFLFEYFSTSDNTFSLKYWYFSEWCLLMFLTGIIF